MKVASTRLGCSRHGDWLIVHRIELSGCSHDQELVPERSDMADAMIPAGTRREGVGGFVGPFVLSKQCQGEQRASQSIIGRVRQQQSVSRESGAASLVKRARLLHDPSIAGRHF